MGPFLRWMALWCHMIVICHSQINNLRPLKGMLNDFDGSKNATEEEELDKLFTLFEDGAPVVIPHVEVAFFQPTRGGSGIESPIRPSDFPAFDSPSLPPERPEPSVIESINDGVMASTHQQQEQSSRPSKELELSAKFLSAFRRAEKEAEEASCVGRALIETTKRHAARLQGRSLAEGVELLRDTVIDQEMCHAILRREGCEDFEPPAPCVATDPYPRMDGSCNNLKNPTWGRAMTPFVRFNYPQYENGVDTMRGEGRPPSEQLPSPRTVSYNLQSIRENPPLSHISLMVMQWGQFLDHDITFTAETQIKKVKKRRLDSSSLTSLLTDPNQDELSCPSHSEGENLDTVPLECCPNGNEVDDLKLTDCRPIDVSKDPLFTSEGRKCMRFVRSLIASKGCVLGPREQLNQITSYIDGSAVYGSSDRLATVLRSNHDGHMHKTETGNLLPRTCCEDRTFHCFKAGDSRVNEQPGLTSVHTLWLRVHENIVKDFAAQNPQWSDDTLFKETRRVVVALIQQASYREWLPVVLGPEAMFEEDLHLLFDAPGNTYDEEVDASVANVIATAAFRFGHTLVNDALRAAGGEAVPLVGNFETSRVLFQNSTRPSAILEGLASANSQAPDFHLVLTLTNKLFAPDASTIGLDLMSLNIQRGRDHGLPPYNSWRNVCNLPTATSFKDLNNFMPSEVVAVFREAYSNVDEIDLFPAALSEFPVDGGLVGPTFACLLGQQFSNLKKGDRFFFQNIMQPKPFTPDQLASIRGLTMAALFCQNSDIEFLQPNVFRSAGVNGNDLQPCSSYPKLDASLWKEKGMPPPGSTYLSFLEQWSAEFRQNSSTPPCAARNNTS